MPWERLLLTLHRYARQGVSRATGRAPWARAFLLNTNKGSSHPNKGPSGKRPIYFFTH